MCINQYFAVWEHQFSMYFGRTALLSREDLDQQYLGSLISFVNEGLEADI